MGNSSSQEQFWTYNSIPEDIKKITIKALVRDQQKISNGIELPLYYIYVDPKNKEFRRRYFVINFVDSFLNELNISTSYVTQEIENYDDESRGILYIRFIKTPIVIGRPT